MKILRWWPAAILAAALSVVVVVSASSGASVLPPPKFARSVDIGLVSGTVTVIPSYGRSFRLGARDRSIPVGSQIDASHGKVDLRSALAPGRASAAASGATIQDAQFGTALFKVRQSRSQGGLTELDLVTPRGLSGACTGGTAASAAARRLSRRVLQTLRAHDNGGRFRTRGRFSAATVRGTVWDTTDRCDGTLTVVQRGSVSVRDFVNHRTIIVYAGHRYLAPAPHG